MTTTTTTATSTYYITVPVTMYQTVTVEAPAGLTKDQVCDSITWERTANQELSKDERNCVLQSLTDSRALIEVEEEPLG